MILLGDASLSLCFWEHPLLSVTDFSCQASRAVEREMAKNYADQMGILYMEPVA